MASTLPLDKDDRAVYERASPTLLSSIPAEIKKQESPDDEWPRLRNHCERSMAGMREWRTSWLVGPWADVARYVEPIRSTFLTSTPGGYASANNQVRGRELNREILDPTATHAVRVCAAGLMSGLASPSRPWFKLIPIDGRQLDSQASEWLDAAMSITGMVLATSNFYQSFATECTDLVTFGTAPVLVYEDDRDFIRLYNPCCGEYLLASDSTMRIGTYARNFVLTVGQLVDWFGLERLPPDVRDLWKQKGNNLHQEKAVAHIIEPNYEIADEKGAFGKIKGGFTWREVYWLYGQSSPVPLSIRGFRDQPFTAARWQTQGNDSYGRSPAIEALPDIKSLQSLTKDYTQAVAKTVKPPLLADVQLKNEPATSIAGGVTYVSGLGPNTGMRPIYQINPDLNGISAHIQDVRQRIQKGFFTDLFLMLDQQQGKSMTAYEVGQRMQEKLQVLGPVIESLLNESLKPKIKRIMKILLHRGVLPPMPESLMGGKVLDVEFVSMLAMAQKAAATGGLERLATMAGHLIAAFPTVGDNLDSDEFLREYNSLLGNPEKILRGPEQVEALRQQKQQQAAAQQRMAMLAQGGPAAAQGAKTLSETKLNSGSALDAMLGIGGGQGQQQ